MGTGTRALVNKYENYAMYIGTAGISERKSNIGNSKR
jgi:hypothetical protein